jgi:hypothetical protein
MLEIWDMEFRAGGKKSALATRRSGWEKTLPDPQPINLPER